MENNKNTKIRLTRLIRCDFIQDKNKFDKCMNMTLKQYNKEILKMDE